MTFIAPVAEAETDDKTARTLSRLREVLELETLPAEFLQMGAVGPFVQDFFMNFRKFVASDGKLAAREKLLIATAVAGRFGSQPWLKLLRSIGEKHNLTHTELCEAVAVSATNSMFNTIYKFGDLAGDNRFEGFSAGLRAHTFTNVSLEERTVELINIAVSTINACETCTQGHVAKSRDLGCSDEEIYESVQCAATMAAAVQFTEAAGSA